MKNMVKLIGLITLVAVIGFSMAACGGDDDGGNTEGTINGSSIASGAPVDIPEAAKSQTDFSYIYHEGAKIVYPLSTLIDPPASVKITNGKVDINLGTPKSAWLESVSGKFDGGGFTITPNDDAKWFALESGFSTSDGKYFLFGQKGDSDYAVLVYADKDVTIKGTGTFDEDSYTEVWDVSLKKGWNYVIYSRTNSSTTTYKSAATLPEGYTWKVFPAEHFK